jgi:hypothetical protein
MTWHIEMTPSMQQHNLRWPCNCQEPPTEHANIFWKKLSKLSNLKHDYVCCQETHLIKDFPVTCLNRKMMPVSTKIRTEFSQHWILIYRAMSSYRPLPLWISGYFIVSVRATYPPISPSCCNCYKNMEVLNYESTNYINLFHPLLLPLWQVKIF